MPAVSGLKGTHLRLWWVRLAVLTAVIGMMVPATSAPIHRIIAVGDLHGDFSAWRDIARAARLVDDRGRWIGGETVLVQTGDVVDRGPDSLKIILDLMRLQREASRSRGKVIALVGNHEAMNVTGDLRYVSAADFAAYTDDKSAQRRDATYAANKVNFEAAYRAHDPQMTDEAIRQAWMTATPLGRLEHLVLWRPSGRIGQWIVSNPAIVMLDGTLFLHGGISPAYAAMPIDDINRQVAAALTEESADPKSIINDPDGPLWYRGLAVSQAGDPAAPANDMVGPASAAVAPLPSVPEQLDRLLAARGAKRIVIAHTPLFHADANGAWNFRQSISKIDLLSKYNVWAVEEPLIIPMPKDVSSAQFNRESQLNELHFENYAKLRSESALPVILDESCISARSVQNAIEFNAMDYINIRLSKLGGYSLTQKIIRAVPHNKKYGIGAMVGETAILASAGYFFGCKFSDALFMQGFSHKLLHKGSVARENIKFRGPLAQISNPAKYGLGLDIDVKSLSKFILKKNVVKHG